MGKWLKYKQLFGRWGESLATRELKRRGYKILEQNYRNRLGEIDIVARDGDTLVFVEVKTRRSRRFGRARYAVTPAKQHKISMVALAYLKASGKLNSRARFDVVAIDAAGDGTTIEIIKNAFSLAHC